MELTEKQLNNFWRKVDKKGDDECWKWFGSYDKLMRGNLTINKINYKAHRISYLISNGYLPNKPLEIRHKCKTKLCVNPKHLESGSHTENMADKIRDGTLQIGENHHGTKLSELQVLEIRQKYIPYKYSSDKLANEYNVSGRCILKIINRETWAHI